MTVPIADVSDVKEYVGITTTATDRVLKMLLGSCVSVIGAFCNRNFTSESVTEYRNGNNSQKMKLMQYPVTAFDSLYIDGIAVPLSTSPNMAGYWFVPGGRDVVLRGYTFTKGNRNIWMSYTGGFGDDVGLAPWPDDLKLALLMFVATRFNERTRLGIGNKTLGTESVTYTGSGPTGTSGASQGIPSAALSVFQNYKNTVPETGL